MPPLVAAAPTIAAVASTAAAAHSIFGNKGGGDSPAVAGGGSAQHGYATAPQWVKDIFENIYGPGINQYFNSPQSQTFIPQQLAGFTPLQEQAYAGLGQNIQGIQQDLGQYMNPYQKFVTDEINRESDIQKNDLFGQSLMGNTRAGFNSSALGTRLAGNDEARQRLLAQANFQNYQQALGLRKQTLSDMLAAGSAQQQQQQAGYNNQYNNAFGQNNAPFNRLHNLSGLLAPLIGGSSSITTTPQAAIRQPNTLQRVAGFARGVNKISEESGFSGLWNDGAPQQGTYGPPAPGLFNGWF